MSHPLVRTAFSTLRHTSTHSFQNQKKPPHASTALIIAPVERSFSPHSSPTGICASSRRKQAFAGGWPRLKPYLAMEETILPFSPMAGENRQFPHQNRAHPRLRTPLPFRYGNAVYPIHDFENCTLPCVTWASSYLYCVWSMLTIRQLQHAEASDPLTLQTLRHNRGPSRFDTAIVASTGARFSVVACGSTIDSSLLANELVHKA